MPRPRTTRSRRLAAVTAGLLAAGLAVPLAATSSSAAAAPKAGALSARTVAQIDALSAAKAKRTPTQNKIASPLLTAVQQRNGARAAGGVGRMTTGIDFDRSGRAAVTLLGDAKAVSAQVVAAGGRVIDASTDLGAVRADVPLSAVSTLAASSAVTRVKVADQAQTSDTTTVKQTYHSPLQARLQKAIAAKSKAAAVTPAVGTVTSEGDKAHAADAARTKYKVSGTGVTVGVLSDGVDSLAGSIASGDLPADTKALPGQEGEGDEGTAMLEIVHDLAPKAKLLFATAFTSAESFADNIRALRAAGANIIVDDVLYYAESPFQDGPIAQAVIDVTNSGALYFSSAGNEGNVDDNTSGNYEGDFVNSKSTAFKFKGQVADFDPGTGVQALDPVSDDGAGAPAILQWADPLGKAKDDYDLYAVGADGNVLAFSNDTQDGNDDPFEGLTIPSGTLGLAVVKFKGAARYFQLTAFDTQFVNKGGLTGFVTPGVTRGHSAVPAAYSVAAVPAATPLPFQITPGSTNPSGPYPSTFKSSQQTEVFTSDGPRRVFFDPKGKALTPGNFTATGGTVRQKPDITAADGVSTSVSGFSPFFGTSAAAPHAAAIAALVLSGNPGISAADVRSALTSTAIDIEAPGTDRDTGAGIVMANRVLADTGATPQPLAVAGQPTVTPTTGDGDAYLEPGESGKLAVPVTDTGDGTATSVSVQVTTTTPGVTITPSTRSYGSIAPGATKTSSSPFTITLASNYPVGQLVQLTFKVSFVGYLSPQSSTATVATGQPSSTVKTVSYTGPAVAIPDGDPTGGVSVPVTVAGVGRASNVTFSLDGSACSTTAGSTTVGIDHTYVGDLVGTLTGPDGTVVTLFSRVGSDGNNFCQTVFSDAGTTSIQDTTYADAPFTGTYQPAQPLSVFVGSQANGTWTFHASDALPIDSGNIRAFSLHVSGYVGGS